MADGLETGTVECEGASLYFEVRGDGPPLLLIAGGGGDAGFFTAIADRLADRHHVITYDRRGNSRSTDRVGSTFEISQQSRDAIAVLRAAGVAPHTRADVVGNSGGGLIALDLAARFPEAVDVVVAHEATLIRMLPEEGRWRRFFATLYWLALSGETGHKVASWYFNRHMQIPSTTFRHLTPDLTRRLGRNQRQLFGHEIIPFTSFLPDIEALKQVKLLPALGRYTRERDLFYGRTTPMLAAALGRPVASFPGHHLGYVDQPKAWAQAVAEALELGRGLPIPGR